KINSAGTVDVIEQQSNSTDSEVQDQPGKHGVHRRRQSEQIFRHQKKIGILAQPISHHKIAQSKLLTTREMVFVEN
ncbi:hypothetical protein, partial [Klebsiella pneumoniae]|uniref:hypothetical protein n=1 Tax=Klebsiella pneumoniae TaxID=573 RepID=UPI003D35C78B